MSSLTTTSKTIAVVLIAFVLIGANQFGDRVSVAMAEAQSLTATTFGTITTIDMPGSASTFALDINAAGVIVGRYLSGGRTHGFLRSSEGEFTTIDVPGASFTATTAINDRGDIVGQYALPSAPAERHGFLLKDGAFRYFDPQGSRFTNALGINERDNIVGRYCTLTVCGATGTGVFHGFLLRDNQFTLIDIPGALETNALNINGAGRIVGGFLTSNGETQLFLLGDNELTTIVPPGGQPVSLTNAGIDERGDVVGTYCDANSPCQAALTGTHGFILSAGGFTIIDIPGASATAASAINARGEIVGGYSDGTRFHGFVLSRWVYQP